LLREVTDAFFERRGARTQTEAALFDGVLQVIAADMQEGVLVELAELFSCADDAPPGLMKDLANHTFAVADSVLRKSSVLDDAMLIQIVKSRSPLHVKSVAQRREVSEVLSEAVIRTGDDQALDTLMRNTGARLSRVSMETVVDRARHNKVLHEGVVGRRDLPLDLLNEMYFVVAAGLREQILERNASVDPATLDLALSKARERSRKSAGDLTAEAGKAIAFIRSKKAAGELNARLLVSLYREAKVAEFLHGLAELTEIDYQTAADLIERKDIDGLAMICRAADIERALFVTLAVLILGGDNAIAKAEEFGRLYSAVPIDAARRAIRFFKVRCATEGSRAA
jgi:uncharacterized protein (DUF2336 family)